MIYVPKTLRKSYIEPGEIFFWTATINQWQNLLFDDRFKDIIIQSLSYLSSINKIDVYAFVIMPNHMHLILQTLDLNGKETPQGSLLKFTAHEFKKLLKNTSPELLNNYSVDAKNKMYEFWKRDSLAVHIFNKEIAFQKLDYIHANPCSGKWKLCKEPHDYKYSSASWYEDAVKNYDFLRDLREEF